MFIQPYLEVKTDKILCLYQNITSHIQIIKITNLDNCSWEKIVFPGQRLFFNAFKQAELSIYSNNNAKTALANTIPCEKLKVDECG